MRKEDALITRSLDERRRATGLTVAQLARLTSIPYQRLWRALTGDNGLSEQESDRLEAALDEKESQP